MNSIQDSLGTLRRQLRRPSSRIAVALVVACLLLCLLGSGRLPATSSANGSTTVRIDPLSEKVSLDNTVTTDVLIENVTDLYG